jgi:uncharacterized membrane protein
MRKKRQPTPVSMEHIRARINVNRSFMDKVADYLTASFGTLSFLLINALFFVAWIVVNLGWTSVPAFDAFPFGLLTMAVSLEAIFLAIIVLISQNRQSRVADIRQQVDLEINVRAEEETTRILNMLDEIHDHLGLAPQDDQELVEMKKNLDVRKLERFIEKEIL